MTTSRLLLVPVLLAACGGSTPNQNVADAPRSDSSGLGADAPTNHDAASSIDPALDGSATVQMTTVSIPGASSGRTLPADVYVPNGASPRPLVVVSPGFQLARTEYASLAHHLATWNFTVVLTDYADQSFSADHALLAADVPAVITWALAQSNLGVDSTKIAVAGHSLGGDISVYAASLDSRIKAVVGWDPVDGNPTIVPSKVTGLTAALGVLGETTDSTGSFACAPAANNFTQFYAAAPSPSIEVTVANADHMSWIDDRSCLVCGLCTAGTATDASVHTITKRFDVAWLRRQLFSDTAMDTWLDHPPELTSGAVAISRR